MEVIKRYYDLKDDKNAQAAFMLKNLSVFTKQNIMEYLDTLDRKYYYYMCTFTLDPVIKGDMILKAEKYIEDQFTGRPALRVAEAYIVKEMTAANREHWHVSVKTEVSLTKDRFNYYTRIYGNVDISKNKSQSLHDGLNYLSKDNPPKRLK